MEILTHKLKPGLTYNFTVYSDLHLDARAAAHDEIRAHMDRRAALPNARFIGGGDLGNWIIPADKHDRRAMAATCVEELAGHDDYIDRCLDFMEHEMGGYPWLSIGMGNHERTMFKHHTHVTSKLAKRLHAKYHGYSAILKLRFGKPYVKWLLHHGAWGGSTNIVPPAALRYANGFADWRIFSFGHHHQCGCRADTRLHAHKSSLRAESRYIVPTGTFLRGCTQGGSPEYSEVAGFAPVPLAAPLIQIRCEGDDVKINVVNGDD